MGTLASNTLEIGLRAWAMDTHMWSRKRREIRSGILTSCGGNLKWGEMLLGVKNRRYMDCRSAQRQRETRKSKTNIRHNRGRRRDIKHVVIGWVIKLGESCGNFGIYCSR
jgi:hypothetical protein